MENLKTIFISIIERRDLSISLVGYQEVFSCLSLRNKAFKKTVEWAEESEIRHLTRANFSRTQGTFP